MTLAKRLCDILPHHGRPAAASRQNPRHHPFQHPKRPFSIFPRGYNADAGQRSAIIYTVIENCRRRALNPYAYLREVLTRLPSMTNWQIPEVTPQAWGKTQLPLQRQAAS